MKRVCKFKGILILGFRNENVVCGIKGHVLGGLGVNTKKIVLLEIQMSVIINV